MSSAVVKRLLKSAREELNKKDYEAARDYCTDVLEIDGENYNALVFLGLAQQNLRNIEKSEDAYKRAIKINPTNPLALQGLANLYTETDNNERLVSTWENLRQLYKESKDGQKCLETTNKLIDHFERSDQKTKTIEVLKTLVPGGEYHNVCAGLDVPPPLELWMRIANLQEQHDTDTQTKEVEARRTRLGADTIDVIKQKVEKEVVMASQLAEIYKNLLNLLDPTVDNQRFLDIGEKYVAFLDKKLPHTASNEKKELYKTLVSFAQILIQHGSTATLPYEIILSSQDVAVRNYHVDFLRPFVDKRIDSPLSSLVSGYISWTAVRSAANDENVLPTLLAGLEQDPSSLFGYRVLGEVYLEQRDYDSALGCIKKATRIYEAYKEKTGCEMPNVVTSLDLSLALTYLLLSPKTLPEALKLYKTVLQRDPTNLDGLQGLGTVLRRMHRLDEAMRCFERLLQLDSTSHLAKAELGWVHFEKSEYEAATRLLEESVGETEDALSLYRLGRVYWALGGVHRTDKQYAYRQWLQAAKLDPQFAPVFTYLGHFYMHIESDRVRAIRCYTRAVSLDAGDEEGVKALSTLFLEEGKLDAAKGLLLALVEKQQRTAWAWKQLGVIASNNDDYVEAISYFQSALRVNSRDARCWEGLGEAYAMDGKYMAALKAFGRSIELEPDNPSLHYQVAALKQKLAMFAESVDSYRQSLALLSTDGKPNRHLPILKGLSESLYLEARQAFESGAHGRCAELLEETIQTASDAISTAELHSLAKILGDACMAYAILIPASVENLEVQIIRSAMAIMGKKLRRLPEDPNEEAASTGIDILLRCAWIAYQLAIQLCAETHRPETVDLAAGYWHDLALSYFYRSQLSPTASNKGESTMSSLLSYAISCQAMAIKRHPFNDTYWNALGVYTLFVKAKISQHAFIKALEANSSNPGTWSNLGCLYLLQGDEELAQQTFSRVQLSDPEWPIGWLGHGLVAERTGKDSLEYLEQAYEMGADTSLEVSYLYASRLYRDLVSNHRRGPSVYATAALCLLKFTQQRPNDWAAHNLLGLVLERQKQYSMAVQSFDRALTALQSGQISQHHPDVEWNVKENRARCLSSSGRFSEATEAYDELGKMAKKGDPYTHISKAFALCFNSQLQGSLSAFEQALQSAAGDSTADETFKLTLQNDVTLMLSQVLYALGSEQHRELAKQQLLSCVARVPQYWKALTALCALGLIGGDVVLASSAAAEIVKIPPDTLQDEDGEIGELLSTLFLMQGDVKAAKGFLSKAIRRYPSRAELWRKLAKLLYSHASTETSSLKSAKAAGVLPIQSTDRLTTTDVDASIKTAIALSSLTSSDSAQSAIRRAKRSLQYAIQSSPGNPNTWLALGIQVRAEMSIHSDITAEEVLPSLHAKCNTLRNVAEQAAALATFKDQSDVRDRKTHDTTIGWASLLKAHSLIAKAQSQRNAPDMVETLRTGTDLATGVADSQISTLQGYAYALLAEGLCIAGNIAAAADTLKKAIATGVVRSYQALASLYSSLGLYAASELCYRQAVLSEAPRQRFGTLLRIGKLGMSIGNVSLTTEAVNEALKLNPGSLAGRCLQALLCLRTGDNGKAMKVLRNLPESDPYVQGLLHLINS